jgi:hypothetical protein
VATFRSFEAFGREIDAMNRDLENEMDRNIAKMMAKEASAIAYREAAKDLGGDPKFSGWKPWLKLEVKQTRSGAVLHPTRNSAGPWTVAERGRNQGNAAGFSGPGINRRTGITSRTKSGGLRKVRSVRAKRWNGRTLGKNTASDAVAAMEQQLPKIAERESRKVIQRHFDVT